MAITLATEILGQEATSSVSYCYLYEPLRVQITESDSTAESVSIELEILDTSNTATVVENLVEYGSFDLNPGQPISIDLMKIAQQYHDANVYNYSHIDEIVDSSTGWQSVVSKYVYNFKISSDKTSTPIEVKKLPIIGGRSFSDFTPSVSEDLPITEAEGLGLDLKYQWEGFPSLETELATLGSTDLSPTIQKYQRGLNRITNSKLLDDSNWNLQSGDSISNGEFIFGGGSGDRSPIGFTPTFGRTYTGTFTIAQVQEGSFAVFDGAGGVNVSGYIDSVGTYSFTYVQSNTSFDKLSLYTASGFRGKMKDISWVEHENLSPIDVTSSGWFSGGDAVLTSGITSPNSSSDAYKLSSSSGDGYISTNGIDEINDGDEVTISVWLKGDVDARIRLQELYGDYTNYFQENISITSTWTRYEVSGIKGVDGNSSRMVIDIDPDSSGYLDIYLPHVENLTKSKRSACGGQLVWKSRLGGWMNWGFKLKKESQAKKYEGNIQVGMFESTLDLGGNAYIPTNYTGISTSYSLTLKDLGLNSNELRAVQSIIASPAVYYMKDGSGSLELMRLSSANAPLDNKANGGDFTASLSSISTSMQKTR